MNILRTWFSNFSENLNLQNGTRYCRNLKITKRLYYDLTSLDTYFLLSFIRQSGLCLESNLTLNVLSEHNIESTSPNFIEEFRCLSERNPLILVPVSIKYYDGPAHATALIIDNRLKTIEYFDPNGSEHSEHIQLILNFLETQLSQVYPNHVIISSESFCLVGPQKIANTSLCAAWSLLYMHARIEFPSLSRHLIISTLLNFDRNRLLNIINGYLCFLYEYGLDNEIFDLHKRRNQLNNVYEKFINSEELMENSDEFDTLMLKIEELVDKGDFKNAIVLINLGIDIFGD